MIPAAELTAMRDVLDGSMPDVAVIFKPVRVKDDSGGLNETWDDQTPVEARISPLAGGVGSASAEALVAGRIGTAEAWVLTVPFDTDIDEIDRLVIDGDRGFEVAVVLGPRSWEISRRVIVVELG